MVSKTGSSSRKELDHQLEHLETGLLDLSSRVEKATNLAIYTLKYRDPQQSQKVIEEDAVLNEQRYSIEQEAMTLLTLQQPIATRDLRYVIAAIQIATELERMGDYAKGIAKISVNVVGEVPLQTTIFLEEMAQQAIQMLHAAMDAFIEQDYLVARKVANQDEVLDEMYSHIQTTFMELMEADTTLIKRLTPLLWAAHNLERIGDRVTNICGRINFVQTGQVKGS